tara:strand:+ start:5485 stop:6045 length:561 start_codon:yes stop_codon:yes gene_type:complete
MKQNNIRKTLLAHPVIPVVSFNSLEEVEPTINLLVKKGINCIEITLRNELAFSCISAAKALNISGFDVGIGTVVSEEQIHQAKEIGVDFMVSPGINENLSSALMDSEIPFIPGVATPSEIILGMQLGWDTFKFFPANLFGGVKALKTYGNVFPSILFCPTGGITEDTHQQYLELSNVVSVGGSWLT